MKIESWTGNKNPNRSRKNFIFFLSWSCIISMVKMNNLGILTDSNGQIRKKCGPVNEIYMWCESVNHGTSLPCFFKAQNFKSN